MVTVSPSIRPFRSRMVNRSRRPWVGCSCHPSPALITLALTARAIRCGAPDERWRITTMSAPNASRVLAVSERLSPLVTLLVEALMLTTSALIHFPASSKEVRVRVLAS